MPRRVFPADLVEAGKRMSDHVNGLLAFHNPWELRTKWLAVALADGYCRPELFDSILDAKKHSDESRCWYFAFINCLGGVNPYECTVMIDFHRKARDAGLNQANPEAQPFMSTYGHDVMSGRLN